MEFGERQEVGLLVDDGLAANSSCLCRICHEEEEESSTDMESPCACSGTIEFAHRECIQRWCDEKGSTVCEICLQAFEPGYTALEKKPLVDVVVVTISSESSGVNYDPENPGFINLSDDASASNYTECSAGSLRSVSCCRSVAITFTVMLLIRHFIAVITVGADHCAVSILTVSTGLVQHRENYTQYAFSFNYSNYGEKFAQVFLLRASGILLPFYFVMRFISAIQQAQQQYQLQQLSV